MNTIRNTVARPGAWLSTIALVAAMHLGDAAFAQATSRPPERMTYQGFIAGSDGVALGNTAPKNYDVIFRIYEGEGSTTALWGEQQTVTVDKGYFSILLGEGAAVPGTPNAGITLSSLFNSATASDRYVGFTVKGVGSGGADLEILPRVRLMTSPYAFLANKALAANTAALADSASSAERATAALKLVQQGNGAELLAASGSELSVKGNLLLNAGKYLMLGVGSGKEISAGMISYQYHTPDSLEIIGAGTTSANRKITLYADGGSSFVGNASFLNNVGVNGNLGVSGILAQGNTQLHPAIDGGIVFGVNRTKEFPWNGSIHYGVGSGFAGQDTLVIEGGGNLVAARSVTTYAEGGFFLYGPLAMPVGKSIQLGFNSPGKEAAAGTIGYQSYSAGLDIVGAGKSQNERKVTFHAQGGTTFNGKVGIGSLNAYPFYVSDESPDGYSAWFTKGVAMSFIYQFSDKRIKDVLGPSKSERDLDTLRGIRVTEYRMKDRRPNNDRPIKGVLAQELREVLPDAVSVTSNIIPNILQDAASVEWSEGTRSVVVHMASAFGIQKGERIRLEADGMVREVQVTDVPDDKTFSYAGSMAAPKKVRVIGREVKDFLSVDYQQVYMTAVSALQEVDRRLQAVDQRVQDVEKRELRVAELEKKAAARVEGLERDMAELRKLVASMQSTKGKAESASAAPSTTPVVVVKSR